jgi:stringent starvation protein B
MAVRSKRPYLIRALNDWIIDSELTPYLMVDATGDEVQVPAQFVSDGRIVLNISPSAVRDLIIGDDAVAFSARFGGHPFSVYVPVGQILAIYAQETNEGMMFEPEVPDQTSDNQESAPDLSSVDKQADDGPAVKPGGHLKLVD